MNRAWLNRYCANGGGSGGSPPASFIPPKISSSRDAYALPGQVFTYQGLLSQGSTLEPCAISWQVSVPNQNWITINPTTGLVVGTPPTSFQQTVVPFYLRAENCMGEDTIVVNLHVGAGPTLYKIWFGNVGTFIPGPSFPYTEDTLFFLDNFDGVTNINNAILPDIEAFYTIYPPRSGENEYQLIAIPKGSYEESVRFFQRNFPLSFSKVQDLMVQGQDYELYRSDARSVGGFLPPSQLEIRDMPH